MDITTIPNILTNGNNAVQKEALGVFESLKENPNGWRLCLDALSTPGVDESRSFFCLLVVENYIKTRYEHDSSENQATLRQFLFTWFSRPSLESNFILNKFAHVVVSVFLIDYPLRKWSSFFNDFSTLCSNERTFQLFLKILLQINAEIADREFNRSQKEVEKGTYIKDLMRETCLLDLARLWFNIIETYRETCPPLVCLTLEVVGSYVAWIDINLITNECFMSRLFSLFDKKDFRCSVCDTFGGILHKGMDPLAKTGMVEQFMSVQAIKDKLSRIVSGTEPNLDEEFMIKLSKLMNTIGVQLIDSLKKSKAKGLSSEQLIAMNDAIQAKYPLLCFFLSHKNPMVSLQIHPFARDYIQFLKRMETTEDRVSEVVKVLTKIVIDKSHYPSKYDFDVDEADSDFDECRKSCRILFENLMLLNTNICVSIVCDDLLIPLLNNWHSLTPTSFPDIEVSLYMFYLLGENSPALSNHHKKLEEVLCLLVSSNISSFPHFTIQMVFFDIVTRYDKLLGGSALIHFVPQLLMSFLDERGFKHQHPRVRSKACQLFNKFLKSNLKGKISEKIQAFTEEIIKRLHDLLRLDIDFVQLNGSVANDHSRVSPSSPLSDDDQLILYETIALLIITNTNYDPTKKHVYLKSVLIENLWKTFEQLYAMLDSMTERTNGFVNGSTSTQSIPCLPASPHSHINLLTEKMSHCIFLVARTSKAFSNVHPIKSIGAQGIYLDSFNMFVKALSLNVGTSNISLLQSAVRQLLHRLIVCLEESEILPLLPLAIEKIFLPCSLTTNANFKTIQELIPLINQVVTKFKHSWMFQRDILPFLKQMFVPLISSIFALTNGNGNQGEVLSGDEVTSLQKCYYTFLFVLSSNNVFEVFTSLETKVLEEVMLTVVRASVEFPDFTTQKMCFGILKKMIECLASNTNNVITNGDDAAKSVSASPSFVTFIYKNIVPACFYAPLRVAEGQDVNQVISESVSCLKVVEAARGTAELASFLQSQLFVEHFPSFPESSRHLFIQVILTGDVKSLKEAFRKFSIEVKKTSR